jgi:hypothetical protein
MRLASPSISVRDLTSVVVVAIAVVLMALLGFAAVNGLLNPRPYARVVVSNHTATGLVAQLADGAASRGFDIPAGASLLLPDGDFAEIQLLDRQCRHIATEKHGGPTAWQLITVEEDGVTVEYPSSSLPPVEEALQSLVCS